MTETRNSLTVTAVRRSLARMAHSSYVRNADGRYFRLCRIQPPGAAPELSRFGNSSVFRSPLRPARCAAARWSGPSPGGGRFPDTTFPGRFGQRHNPLPGPLIPRERFVIPKASALAPCLASSNWLRGGLAAQCFIRADAWCARLCRRILKDHSRRCGVKIPHAALILKLPVRQGARDGVSAFPSPPNQVDRRVTRRRDTRPRWIAPAAAKS